MPAADIVLRNANVITMDARRPSAELVAITGDKISLVTGKDGLELAAVATTRVIDCQGKTVVPGFNDAHCHLFSFIRKLLSIDLSPSSVSSIADIKSAIHQQAESTTPGTWLSGTDFNEFYLAEKRYPNRWDIDEVAPEHPVVLSHRTLHSCVLNSMALSLAGITAETNARPGTIIERDPATGEPNGILFEMLGYIREKVMPPLTGESIQKGAALVDRYYRSYGITSLHDASPSNDYRRWQFIVRLKEDGKLRSRMYMMLGNQSRRRFQERGLISGSGNNQLRLGAVKFILTETTGELQPPPAELNQQALDCHRDGFQMAFHAVEESVVAAAVRVLEHVHGQSTVIGRRYRIEHCSECPPHLLERLRALKAVIVTQPPFIYYSGERYLATVAASQMPWLYRIKSPLQSGLIVAAGSDSPIVPNNPLVGIYAAVTRKAESGQVLLPEERVSASQALAMYTINAAYASFEEGIKGSITPGKLADIVVLSDDPVAVPPEQIKDIRVEMTIIGGKIVWEG